MMESTARLEGGETGEILDQLEGLVAAGGSPEAAFQQALRLVRTRLGWPLAHALVPIAQGGRELVSSGVWDGDDLEPFQLFREASEVSVFAPGIGLPGRGVEALGPVWIEDVLADPTFSRIGGARRAGIRSAFAFPAFIDDEIVCVLEFFTCSIQPPSAEVMELGRVLGPALGRLLERQRAGAVRRTEAEWARVLAEARASARRAEFLAQASSMLGSSLDYDTTLRNVADLAVPFVADWCAVDLVDEDGSLRRLAVAHLDPAKVSLAHELQRRYPTPPDAPHGVPQALRSGQPEFVPDVPEELLAAVAHDADHLELLRSLRLRSYIVAPLATRGRMLGAMVFVYAESNRRYGPDDLRLIVDLAGRAAIAIENAQLVRDVNQAREQLEQQADELAAQAEELQEAMEELEANTEDLHRANEELAARTAEAEEANRAKSQFLATMSHELRTPLNAIAGYTQLLDEGVHGTVSEPQRRALARIQTNQHRLLALVNDLLQFARIEAGQLQVDLKTIPVAELLTGLDALVEPQIRARSLAYSYDPCDPALAVRADREKVEQILLNLLSNAIKFTAPGGRITVGCEEAGEWIDLVVSDTGRGVPADKLEAIFEPFVQLARPGSEERTGVGLGLAISRDLAHIMDGDLTVASEEGRGSTFTCRLRRAD